MLFPVFCAEKNDFFALILLFVLVNTDFEGTFNGSTNFSKDNKKKNLFY